MCLHRRSITTSFIIRELHILAHGSTGKFINLRGLAQKVYMQTHSRIAVRYKEAGATRPGIGGVVPPSWIIFSCSPATEVASSSVSLRVE
jgi:hypothetical protein